MRNEVEKVVRFLITHVWEEDDVQDAVDEYTDDIMAELPPVDLSAGWQAENEAMRAEIVSEIFPAVLALWLRKNEDYRGQQVFLGSKAQFADVNRKFWKLKNAMWDGIEPDFETVEQIAADMIGHLLMTIYFQRHRGDHG